MLPYITIITLHRFESFSANRTIAHGSIRLPPRSLASSRGCSLAMTRNRWRNIVSSSRMPHQMSWIPRQATYAKIYWYYTYNYGLQEKTGDQVLRIFPGGIHAAGAKFQWLTSLGNWVNRLFYRYSGHIELIGFKEYYGMTRGHEHDPVYSLQY